MKILGLILARGGSKRIPRKNVKILGEAPLVAWTISEGEDSLLIDDLYVSSDDDEILDIAKGWRCGTIRRPAEHSGDFATSYQAIFHALDTLDEQYDYVALLQPTSPFRSSIDIDLCIGMCMKYGSPAYASFRVGDNVPNGGIYVGATSWLRDGGSFDSAVTGRYDMPHERSLDIDTPDDWDEAEECLARYV